MFGVGVSRFYQRSEEFAKRFPPDIAKQYPENAHNYYLQVAAETGLVGAALFVGFLAWLLRKHWTSADPTKLACGTAVVTIMIFGLTQHPLLVDRFFFVFVTVCAALAASGDTQNQRNELGL